MTAAGERSEAQIEIEKEKEYRLDLKEADLKNVYLEDANLEKVNLYRANLEGASLLGSTLGGSNLTEADLSSADLRKCQTLTQEQVDRAVAQQDHVGHQKLGRRLVADGRVAAPLIVILESSIDHFP